MWNQLLSVMIKELRQTRRDKRTLLMLLVAPAFQLLVLGFAVDLNVSHVPTTIVDLDHTTESRKFVAGLLADETFDLVLETSSPEAGMDSIVAGEASVAFVIPRGFSADLYRGDRPAVQALVDGGDANRATISQNAMTAFGATWSPFPRQALFAMTEVRPLIRYNPGLSSSWFFVPGIAGTLLMTITTIVSAMGLSREKETGTLEQVLVTPIPTELYMLGKVLPYAAIGMVTLYLIVTLGILVFGVPMRGSLLVLSAGGGLYILSALAIGLLASTFAKNQQQAFLNAFFAILPAILLSGFMTPVANMPEPLRTATLGNPMRHFVEVSRAVMLKGAGFGDLHFQFAALAIIGFLTFFGAAALMRAKFGR